MFHLEQQWKSTAGEPQNPSTSVWCYSKADFFLERKSRFISA